MAVYLSAPWETVMGLYPTAPWDEAADASELHRFFEPGTEESLLLVQMLLKARHQRWV